MNIVLLGANGKTGREVLKIALGAGDNVTALVRTKSALSDIQHDSLHVHAGDVCDPKIVASLLKGQDIVISTLGPRSPRKAPCTIYSKSAASIVKAMEGSDVTRLLVTSTALLFPKRNLFDRILGFIAGNNAREAQKMENIIQASTLNWCFARVGFLNNAPTTHFISAKNKRAEGKDSISRSAVAHFLYQEALDAMHGNCVVGLCN